MAINKNSVHAADNTPIEQGGVPRSTHTEVAPLSRMTQLLQSIDSKQ